jgi:hypothetical protein
MELGLGELQYMLSKIEFLKTGASGHRFFRKLGGALHDTFGKLDSVRVFIDHLAAEFPRAALM